MASEQSKMKTFLDLSCWAIFLLLFTLLLAGVAYFLGNEMKYCPSPKPLYTIYQQPQYLNIFEEIDRSQYHVVEEDMGDDTTFLINAYADSRNFTILNRHYNESEYQAMMKSYLWSFSCFVNQHFQIQQRGEKKNIWVLYLHGKSVSLTDITQIKASHPHDKIIVVFPKKPQIKGFKSTLQIPPLDMKNQLQQVMKIPQKLAKTFMSLYSKQELFDIIHENSKTLQNHLEDHYIPLSQNTKKVKKILKKLCKNGQQSVGYLLKTVQAELRQMGVVVVNHVAYWASDEYRLNYILQKGKKCKKIQLPLKVHYHGSQLQEELLMQRQKQNQKKKQLINQNTQCECKCQEIEVNEENMEREKEQMMRTVEDVPQVKDLEEQISKEEVVEEQTKQEGQKNSQEPVQSLQVENIIANEEVKEEEKKEEVFMEQKNSENGGIQEIQVKTKDVEEEQIKIQTEKQSFEGEEKNGSPKNQTIEQEDNAQKFISPNEQTGDELVGQEQAEGVEMKEIEHDEVKQEEKEREQSQGTLQKQKQEREVEVIDETRSDL